MCVERPRTPTTDFFISVDKNRVKEPNVNRKSPYTKCKCQIQKSMFLGVF